MKNVFIAISCCLMIFSGCSQSTCNKEAAAGCCVTGKDSLQVVMNLHRKVKPECVSAFKASFEKCRESTMSEPGCLDYGMYQSYLDSTEFFIAETWLNKPEHLKHMETSHLKLHLEEIKEMVVPSTKTSATIYVCPKVN